MKKNVEIMHLHSGSALITLLIFMVIAMAVTSTATLVLINTTRSSSVMSNSYKAQSVAESGVENAMIRLLRDGTYPGETLSIGDGTATVTVTGTTTKTITSTGIIGNFRRTVIAVATYVNRILTITSWSQSY